MNKNVFFGIDFGTTCSATVGCAVAGEKAHLTRYDDGSARPMLSSVAIDRRDGSLTLGRDAWEKRLELGENCEYVPSVKAILGTDWRVDLPDGESLAPDTLAEALFAELKRQVFARTKLEMRDAVVAIPVGFDARKRAQLRSAAQRAGIRIESFVSEPTAAFFANFDSLRGAHTVAVFDWGGGTLDVSILRHEKGKVYELASAGLPLAGNHIDESIARHVHAKFCRKSDCRVSFEELDARTRDMLLSRCEDVKRDLSYDDESVVNLNRYGEFGSCRVPVEYAWFRQLVAPFVDQARDCLSVAIGDAGLTPETLDYVLLTGGSSELRPLQETLSPEYGDRIVSPEEKVWSVAEGATRLARFPGARRSAQRIGLRLADDSYFGLLEEDDLLEGWSKTSVFGLTDDSEQARIVFTGSNDIDEDPEKRQILEFPRYNFLHEKVLLRAEVDEDLVFRVTARSDRQSDEFRRVWEYEGLKTYYYAEPPGGRT